MKTPPSMDTALRINPDTGVATTLNGRNHLVSDDPTRLALLCRPNSPKRLFNGVGHATEPDCKICIRIASTR